MFIVMDLKNKLKLGQFINGVLGYVTPLWLFLFVLLPILMILRIALSEETIGILPFEDILSWGGDNQLKLNINLNNFIFIFENKIYFDAIVTSVVISFISAIICLFIAYPVAYFIAMSPRKTQPTLLVMIIIPFWTSFIIRVYAWLGLLGKNGFINYLLLNAGLISDPFSMLYNDYVVVMGIVYSYLPFMVLPLYSALDKMDTRVLEAAYDLGCSRLSAFFKVTIPMTKRAIITGFSIVFIPGIGEYIVPELLGGDNNMMIGKLLWSEFFSMGNWPLACALAVVIIVIMLIPFLLLNRDYGHRIKGENIAI